MKKILENVLQMVRGYGDGDEGEDDNAMYIWDELPHFTWDNYFSGDQIFNHLGLLGFGALMTCRRDRLPAGIPEKYLSKKKTDTKERSKVARFNRPIVLVNESATHQRVHVSFQSTSSCNLSLVNLLPKANLYVTQQERGRGEHKRYWGIEMNDAREDPAHQLYPGDNNMYRVQQLNKTSSGSEKASSF